MERIIRGEKFDLYEEMISSHFEYIAAEILTEQLEDGIWYDGVSGLVATKQDHNKIVFSGSMYICLNQDKFWQEPFTAIVTVKASDTGKMPIYVKIGELEAEKDLLSMVWKYRNT